MKDSRWRNLSEVTRDIILLFISLLFIAVTLIGFLSGHGFKALALIFFLVMCAAIYYAYQYKAKAVPYYVLKDEAAMAKATKLLKEAKDNLYYYGGAGFIGKYTEWKQEYTEKLRNGQFEIYRFLDTKEVDFIKNLGEEVIDSEFAEEDSREYIIWLKTHAEYLRRRGMNNIFYDFDGAPIWKYGLNFIIFDERHIVIAFLSDAGTRTAIFITDNPKIANSLCGHAKFLRNTFFHDGGRPGRRVINADDLLGLAEIKKKANQD